MTQKLKIKITENGITRDATPEEIIAWHLIQTKAEIDEFCGNVVDRCSECILSKFECCVVDYDVCEPVLKRKKF